jgi:hypothetical protein
MFLLVYISTICKAPNRLKRIKQIKQRDWSIPTSINFLADLFVNSVLICFIFLSLFGISNNKLYMYKIHWYDVLLCQVNQMFTGGVLMRVTFYYRVAFYFWGGGGGLQEVKRTWLNISFNVYEHKLQKYEQQCENEFKQLKTHLLNSITIDGSSFFNYIKEYMTSRTNRLKQDICPRQN